MKRGRPPKNGKKGGRISASLNHVAMKVLSKIPPGERSQFISHSIIEFALASPFRKKQKAYIYSQNFLGPSDGVDYDAFDKGE